MKAYLKRILSLMCAVAVAATTMAACKGNSDTDVTSSDEYEIEYIYESADASTDETGEDASSDADASDGDSSDTESSTSSENTSSSTSSKNTSSKNTSSKKTSSKKTSSSTSSKKTSSSTSSKKTSSSTSSKKTSSSTSSKKTSSSTSSKNNSSTAANTTNDYKGTTIKFAVWSDHNKDSIKAFEKETGIKVEVVNTSEGEYITNIAGKIASGTGPDVVFDNGRFPASLQILQPITVAETIDLSDPIWDKGYNDLFTFNGKVYEVAAKTGYWTEMGLFFYNKKIFKNAGYDENYPKKLYESGKWNWDTLEKLMSDMKSKLPTGTYPIQKGDDIQTATKVGASLYYYDLKSKEIKCGAGDSYVTEVLTRLSKWSNTDHYYGGEFINGTSAMCFSGIWGLRNNGAFAQMKNKSDIGFTYCPDYSSTQKAPTRAIASRGFGIAKGSKEPNAAGLFIRYYLDINNYDLSSEFISEEARDFFFECANRSPDYFTCERGVMEANGKKSDALYNFAIYIQPDQMINQINAQKNVLVNYAKKANQMITNNTK